MPSYHPTDMQMAIMTPPKDQKGKATSTTIAATNAAKAHLMGIGDLDRASDINLLLFNLDDIHNGYLRNAKDLATKHLVRRGLIDSNRGSSTVDGYKLTQYANELLSEASPGKINGQRQRS
ncbi:MAG: hypothetical protein NTV15_00945 [Candidatus Bathyarchaeota archaeon]|nr:hypothetical protein [Candidatus Bathyarchaeota archaeon]